MIGFKEMEMRGCRKFFIGIAVLCILLALIILFVMLQPEVTGNVVLSYQDFNGSRVNLISSSSSEIMDEKENFIKHIIRKMLESWDDYVRF